MHIWLEKQAALKSTYIRDSLMFLCWCQDSYQPISDMFKIAKDWRRGLQENMLPFPFSWKVFFSITMSHYEPGYISRIHLSTYTPLRSSQKGSCPHLPNKSSSHWRNIYIWVWRASYRIGGLLTSYVRNVVRDHYKTNSWNSSSHHIDHAYKRQNDRISVAYSSTWSNDSNRFVIYYAIVFHAYTWSNYKYRIILLFHA